MFDWPERELSDVEFLTLICRRDRCRGFFSMLRTFILMAAIMRSSPITFIDALPTGAVREVHIAGGETVSENWEGVEIFSPIPTTARSPEGALDLLDYALARHAPRRPPSCSSGTIASRRR